MKDVFLPFHRDLPKLYKHFGTLDKDGHLEYRFTEPLIERTTLPISNRDNGAVFLSERSGWKYEVHNRYE